MTDKTILVSVDLRGKTYLAGRLFCHSHKSRESAGFEYDRSWLSNPEKFAFEPALALGAGQFQTADGQKLFGALGDSAPDRWGRQLMQRAEPLRAEAQNKTAHSLTEADYLLGVNDTARMGALRFSHENAAEIYLAEAGSNPIPPLVDLPKLLSASDDFQDFKATAPEIQQLLEPGSSLGGARAKASVRDGADLYIAKFPQKNDTHNVILWEILTLELAEKAGLILPPRRSLTIGGRNVLLVKRFDRRKAERIPFLSAMSMLGAKDKENGHSYLELADALSQCGAAPAADKEQLWRRIVFTVLISNTDDHLRNHGFLCSADERGWPLSPAYDLNPISQLDRPRFLSSPIDFNDSRTSLDLALATAEYYNLS